MAIGDPTWTQIADVEENDLTDFNSTTTSGAGLIAASTTAALAGTYGVLITTVLGTANETAYGTLSGTTNKTEKTIETLFDPNALTMALNDTFFLIRAGGSGAISTTMRVDLLFNTSSQYTITAIMFNDASGAHATTASVITDASHTIRIVWKASTAVGANNGYLYLYIDDVFIEALTGIDNDGYDIDTVAFGAFSGIDAGTGGTFFLDNCQVYDGIYHSTGISGSATLSGDLDVTLVALAFPQITTRLTNTYLTTSAVAGT